VEFITHFYPAPRLRMVGAIPLLPYIPSGRAKRKIYLLFLLEFNNNNAFLLLIACL
jgi:hypothetical protein